MAYDAELADGVRTAIGGEPNVTEKRMFGGLAFLLAGNMAVAASSAGGIIVRVDPDQADELAQLPGVSVMEMRGRPTRGWLRVTPEELRSEAQLAEWVGRGMDYARSLAPKP